MPFPLQLPAHLSVTLQRTADRLGIKRGDVLCELLHQYADTLELPDDRPDRPIHADVHAAG